MKNQGFYIISQLLRGAWLIDPAHAQARWPFVQSYLNGDFKALSITIEQEDKDSGMAAFAGGLEEREYYSNLDEAPQGSISLTRLEGEVMKQGYCMAGTAELKQRLAAADRHPNVSGHMLILDSPGGTVDGTKEFADAIKATTKPIVAYVDGLAASAAFWLASAADEIIASSDTTMLGSIGTMISFVDFSAAYEEFGIKQHNIYADKSTDKNQTYHEAIKGNYKPIKEESLNPINEIFLNAVRTNRKDISEKALTGKMFLAQDAIAMGMTDAVGDFEFALSRLEALMSNTQIPISQTTNSTMFSKNKFPKLSALANQETLSDEALEAASQELQAAGISNATIVADTALESMTAESGRLSGELATATARVATLQQTIAVQTQSIASLTAERDAAQALATEYGAQPGASHTEPVKPEGDQLEEDDNQTLIDSLPHNQVADQTCLTAARSIV